jgi:FkbH-like protein
MIQAQGEREAARALMPREEFLEGLGVVMTRLRITSTDHPRFSRAFELLNKSNQFNTTGQRWSPEAMHGFLAGGGRIEAFEVADHFTQYGLVGLALIEGAAIVQFVMSCRVLGLEVEACAIAMLAAELLAQYGVARAVMVATEANLLCRALYEKAGFVALDGHWVARAGMLRPAPGHIRLG